MSVLSDLDTAVRAKLTATLVASTPASGQVKEIKRAKFLSGEELGEHMARFNVRRPVAFLSMPDFIATEEAAKAANCIQRQGICQFMLATIFDDQRGIDARATEDGACFDIVDAALTDQLFTSGVTSGWSFDPIVMLSASVIENPEYLARIFQFSVRIHKSPTSY